MNIKARAICDKYCLFSRRGVIRDESLRLVVKEALSGEGQSDEDVEEVIDDLLTPADRVAVAKIRNGVRSSLIGEMTHRILIEGGYGENTVTSDRSNRQRP